jgi:HEXXH motif-containing protein
VELLDKAAQWIGLERNLATISAEVVDHIHLLRSAPGYDISHSEPRWRSSIFVSVPEKSDDVGALRLAESVIHEAMHLHLTNQECAEPLVAEFRRRMQSPWRTEPRSYQGVLHGLFVFSCLIVYFHRTASIRGSGAEACHREKRIAEIRSEIATLDIARLCTGLTPKGAAFARLWRRISTDPEAISINKHS